MGIAIILVLLSTGCEELFKALFGGIDITGPEDGTLTASSRITVSVKAYYDDIDYIDLEVNGSVVHTTSESEFDCTVTLSPGSNTITAVCYTGIDDYAGEDSITVYYDAYPPVITITQPVSNWSIVATADLDIQGTVTDAYGVASFSYLDGTSYQSLDVTGNDWNLPLTGLTEGTYSYMFRARDTVGHSVVRTITFTVDLP